MTEGEYRVGISFNPSDNLNVSNIKSKAAELIDYIMKHGRDERCTALACTEIETAAMYGVKSVTKPPRD